jgi:hypothetical protein
MEMETWKHGDIDMRNGNMEQWRYGDMDMEACTWRHGHGDTDMEIWTWRQGNKQGIHGILKNGKRKRRRFPLFVNSLIIV